MYILSGHTASKPWVEALRDRLKIPISLGSRLIIIPAGGETGFIMPY